MINSYHDTKFNFNEIFDTGTGMYVRTGVLDANGKDTNVDPFMRSFPALIDIGVKGSCEHGRSGLCLKAGIQCYQNGRDACNPDMTFENYKRIIDEGSKKGLFQCALGGAGDPDMHEQFEDILRYSAEHNVVPNFTTSGFGMTPEKAKLCKQYCGAVAVSWYSRLRRTTPELVYRRITSDKCKAYRNVEDIPAVWTFGNANPDCHWDDNQFGYVIHGKHYDIRDIRFIKYHKEPQKQYPVEYYRVFNEYYQSNDEIPNYTVQTIQMLLHAGVKTNVHFVLGKNTIDEAILRLKYGGFPAGINAVIFLLHKPVGLGKESNVLQPDDPRVAEFFALVDKGNFPFKVGFDSCSVPAILNNTSHIAPESIDSCEGGRFSMYITSDMKALPCSFDNQEMRWAYDISNDSIANAWNSSQFNDFRSHFTNSCPNCPNRTSCYGGCPIRRSTVVCARQVKDLQ